MTTTTPAPTLSLSDYSEEARAARPQSLLLVEVRAFLALLQRDLLIARRELLSNLLQWLMLPTFLLFILGNVLPRTGLAQAGYGVLLLPGIVAISMVTAGLLSITTPLVMDIGNEREIEDRLLAPLPVAWVALEKVLFSVMNSLVAGACVFPLAFLILGSAFQIRPDMLGVLSGLMILSAMASVSLGLALGTAEKPEQIGVFNALMITPMMSTGCVFFSWTALGSIKWFQIVTLFNPLTYAAEGLRGAMLPASYGATLDIRWVLLGLAVTTVVFLGLGIRGFIRRAVR